MSVGGGFDSSTNRHMTITKGSIMKVQIQDKSDYSGIWGNNVNVKFFEDGLLIGCNHINLDVAENDIYIGNLVLSETTTYCEDCNAYMVDDEWVMPPADERETREIWEHEK